MARVIFCLACDSVIVDGTSNKLSLINILEQINVQRKDEPGSNNFWIDSNLNITICTFLTRSDTSKPEEVRGRLRFFSHEEIELGAKFEFPVDLEKSITFRSSVVMPTFPVYVSDGQHQQLIVVELWENDVWVQVLRTIIHVVTEEEG